jgi:two-component sensor histidine kinase/PAS domain-containing protein/ActR/RegA family two-component response regulator
MHRLGQTPAAVESAALPLPLPEEKNSDQDVGAKLPKSVLVLAWAVCLMPLLLFAALAVTQRSKALSNGELAVARSIQILEEHALRVFEAQQLIIDQTDQFLDEMPWEEIRESRDIHLFLRETADRSPHVDGLWLVPPDARTANSADFFPFPEVDVADRRYFQALSGRDELHFGEMIVGRLKGNLNFNISRRRSPRETFNGVILVTSSLDYFTDFWEQASDGPFVAGIFREDGEILARYPLLDALPERLDADSPMLGRLRTSDDDVYPSVSSLDGGSRLYGYSRIGSTPLLIGYGVPISQILANWRHEMVQMGLIALMASGLLAIAALTITRQNRHLGATAISWRRAAEQLQQEVNRRVRAEDVAAERKRLLEEVRALTAHRQTILENMAEAVLALDGIGRIIYANREATRLLGPVQAGQQEFASLVEGRRILAADGAVLKPSQAPDRAPRDGQELPATEYLVRNDAGQHAACIFRGGPIFDEDGHADGAVLTFWDVTDRKRDAERRELLMRELDHRVRNMLATIMAMIRISNEPRQSKAEFVTALSGRVGAMARTYGVLSEGRWEGATMGRLVDDEVGSASRSRQLVLDGDRDLTLPPKEAADLSLAFHELATNAIKYGAWSVPEGQVTLCWHPETASERLVLRVTWKETGGPAISTPPKRKGFGTSLLQGIFAGEDGVDVDFEPDGLRCTMTVALDVGFQDRTTAKPPPGIAPPDKTNTSVAGIRVLVVEDEAVVRLDLVGMLREFGANVVADAGSLAEGLKLAEAVALDVAVLDRNLNGESSLPVARLLAKRGIPVVYVSGYRNQDQGPAGTEESQIHLEKPVSPKALLTALAKARRQEKKLA